MTTSGIYLFSQFTHEALLFEALIICMLTAAYTGFWVLKKRRLGAIQNAVPAHVVKDYLNELIVDAEQLRNQLFGLLSAAGISVNANTARIAATAPSLAVAANLNPSEGGVDPMVLEKMASLETKIADQTNVIERYIAEKARIEKDLAEARAASPSSPGKAAEAEMVQLRDKIGSLEGKLAEYSVIEDDLANLKRLQQENIQLRAALQGAGVAAPAPTTAAAAAQAKPAEATQPAPTSAPQVSSPEIEALIAEPALAEPALAEPALAEPALAEPALAEPAAAATAEASPAAEQAALATEPEPSFEGLVDQVEQSLEPADQPRKADSTSQPAAANMGKSDADLVAEFEKMLNS
jgi:hypothetical protein